MFASYFALLLCIIDIEIHLGKSFGFTILYVICYNTPTGLGVGVFLFYTTELYMMMNTMGLWFGEYLSLTFSLLQAGLNLFDPFLGAGRVRCVEVVRSSACFQIKECLFVNLLRLHRCCLRRCLCH